ncbi:TPA: hypothetical protein U1C15_001401 [Streptococcus suis]|nr:hypothetical protein [Streptococcus suis]
MFLPNFIDLAKSGIYSFDFIDLSNPENHTIETVKILLDRAEKVVSELYKETGIDIISKYKNGNYRDIKNKFNDNKSKFLKFMLEKTGYNSKPVELNSPEGYNRMYRGVTSNPSMGINATDFYERFKSGELDISSSRSSAFGRGIYVNRSKATAEQ